MRSTMPRQPVIAIHGGAGTIAKSGMTAAKERAYQQALGEILLAGQRALAEGASALDAVTVAVTLLEDCVLFNAGRGAVFTCDATHELDASIMDGTGLAAGAVACVKRVRNPILAARAVMEHSGHVLMVGDGADAFAQRHGVAMVEPGYFSTPQRLHQLHKTKEQGGMRLFLDHDGASHFAAANAQTAWMAGTPDAAPIDPDTKFGTVGAVACDVHGHVAAATSTGGLTNKAVGRVGDTPIIGAGCYAANTSCAVSCTGTGEAFIKIAAAHDVAALMEYRALSLADAADCVVQDKLVRLGGRGGLVAVDARGNVVLPFNTEGMYRGYARVGQAPMTAIYA
ncbi:peptidase T2, asparaginase 2 [Verminephrobacter eiseniae EF01-2]|uniref:Isoaspartyl peptidase n=2 Tax=Verminephrobacter eiseniae TaxID=364317 RepID=A1WPP8_VEREI|nr:peptidase T2, asparaginase 2 [Verminephrobacter eiseniae EF01-2]